MNTAARQPMVMPMARRSVFLSIVGALGLLELFSPRIAKAAGLEDKTVLPQWFGAKGDGSTNDAAAFTSANLATPGELYLPPATYSIATNTTLTAAVRFAKGAVLKIANGVTLTLNGPFSADRYQIFDISPGGKVALGPLSCREVIPHWWGALGDDSHDDYAAVQACLDAAFGPTSAPHSPTANIPVYIPPGKYRLSATLNTTVTGGHIYGHSRQASVLKIMAANSSALNTHGCAYSVIERLTFTNAAGPNSAALFNLDSAGGDVVHVQQVTVRDCLFDGGSGAYDGMAVGAGNYQADTVTVDNCLFINCYHAGYGQYNANALGNTIIGCDVQGCINYGIYIIGQANIISCNFENFFGPDSAGVSHSGTYQITDGGYDIVLNGGSGDMCLVEGCRSESFKFLYGTSCVPVLTGNYQIPGAGVGRWAGTTSIALNALVTGSITGGDGQLYKCTTAGTTAGSEPAWPGSSGLTVSDGTAVWTQMEFDVIHMGVGKIDTNWITFGQVLISTGSVPAPITVIGNVFSRQDWLHSQYFAQGPENMLVAFGNVTARGMISSPFNAGVLQGQYEPGSHGALGSVAGGYVPNFLYHMIHNLGGNAALMFGTSNGAGNVAGDVGIARAGVASSQTFLSNILAVFGTLGRLDRSGTNLAGQANTIAAGRGTGNGVSGTIDFHVAPAGSSGTGVNPLADTPVGQFDDNATAGNTRFLLWDVTKGALSRVSVGANDSGGSGYKTLRVPN